MSSLLKIGLIVADENEYKDYLELTYGKTEAFNFYSRIGHKYSIKKGHQTIGLYSVLCGIGTVNAAAAAMFLVSQGVKLLFNFGLSGGVFEVSRGQDVIGTSFMEYDFDLTPCGYKKCVKPGQKYIYEANKTLNSIFLSNFSDIKEGRLASGDRFVSDPVLRDALKNEFKINCCDMETSAIAYVADLAGLPFASLRRVSDDAGEDALAEYREMNLSDQSSQAAKVLKVVNELFFYEEFWD